MIYIGIIIGLLIAVLVFTILAFFRAGIEKKIIVVENILAKAGPQPKGFILEPEDESDVIRKEIIEKNNREGRDTKLSELM